MVTHRQRQLLKTSFVFLVVFIFATVFVRSFWQSLDIRLGSNGVVVSVARLESEVNSIQNFMPVHVQTSTRSVIYDAKSFLPIICRCLETSLDKQQDDSMWRKLGSGRLLQQIDSNLRQKIRINREEWSGRILAEVRSLVFFRFIDQGMFCYSFKMLTFIID